MEVETKLTLRSSKGTGLLELRSGFAKKWKNAQSVPTKARNNGPL